MMAEMSCFVYHVCFYLSCKYNDNMKVYQKNLR
jgi:hypothetical protein